MDVCKKIIAKKCYEMIMESVKALSDRGFNDGQMFIITDDPNDITGTSIKAKPVETSKE